MTSEVAIALSQHGTVSPSIIHQRVGFATSMTDGRTVMEIQGQKPASEEIAARRDAAPLTGDLLARKG